MKTGQQQQVLLIFSLVLTLVSSAHVHNHVHNTLSSKERISDGHYSADGKHNADFDHQAVLGSRKDAKQFDQLSDEDSKQKLRQLVIKKIDLDGNGSVDMIELKDWIMKSFHKLTMEEGTDQHHEEDSNKDGYVTWEEHLSDAFDINLDTDFEELADPENRQLLDEDRALWKAADIDKDDKLNVTEFTMFNSPEEFVEMRDVLFELTMIRRDKNKDGFIDLHEFMQDEQGLLPDSKSQNYISEKDRFVNEYDENKDGKLNRLEVLKWLIPDNEDSAEQEAEHLFLATDDNDDNMLSVDEIVKHHDVWVGSEATDFGDRLKNLHDEL